MGSEFENGYLQNVLNRLPRMRRLHLSRELHRGRRCAINATLTLLGPEEPETLTFLQELSRCVGLD